MPTYDYECDACGHEFELFQSITESVKRKCPECTQPKLKRLIGIGGGVIFKGSGFYETDYRSASYKKGAEAEKKKADGKKPDSKSKSDTGSSKTDSKTTSKPDAKSNSSRKAV